MEINSGFYYGVAICYLALGFGFLHQWHVSTLFENDRHFSHLSEIEREMSFRTEMGMYYSYYKTIVESKTFLEGFNKITKDNISQYPDVIDATKKYNLFPEIFIGFLYHTCKTLGIVSKPQCWQIERGDGLSKVTSCEGSGVPIYFYLEVVWYCAAATGAVLFLYSTYLSDSVYGGTIAIICFFYNHTECTRVQWTPPLRESFAYPALLSQMYSVTIAIREYRRQDADDLPSLRNAFDKRLTNIGMFTTLSLLCWQFSQFVFATQLIALLILMYLGVISKNLYLKISTMHLIAIALVVPSTESNLLTGSIYTCLLLASNWINYFLHNVRIDPPLAVWHDISGTLGIVYFLKYHNISWLATEDDAHIFEILMSKLTNYKSFHTLLYTCSAEFDFLQYSAYEAIVKTLLLPTAVLSGILTLYYWYRHYKLSGYPKCIEADVAYNALQAGAFVIMAFFVMRLKLFMTPHLCIMAGLVASKRYLEKVGVKSESVRGVLVFLLIAGMSSFGLRRLQEERGFIGEYSNVEQEELFEWIKINTPKNSVFAGKMSLMANVMLSTGRAVVNNPYYEDKRMRDRTLRVYQIFGRKDATSVYDILRRMEVDYVILEEGLCYGLGNTRPGCQMVDLWDLTDNYKEKKAGRQPLCPILFRGRTHPFRRVFKNDHYVVLRLDYLKSVELMPKITKFYRS